MAWTWDSYRHSAARWERAKRRQADPLRRFIRTVDVIFYAATAALAGCIGALLFA